MSGVRVALLNNGWLEGDINWMVAMTVRASVDDLAPACKWTRFPVMCALIDHPEKGYILYDAGCHPDTMYGYHPEGHLKIFPYYFESDQCLEKQLEMLGVKPEEIKTVVISHTHYDHMGNLSLFPNAEIIVPRLDYENALQVFASTDDTEAHISYVKKDFEGDYNWVMAPDADFELAKGIDVIHLPGHCPDVLALMVTLGSGEKMILPSDAVSSRAVYGPPANQTTYLHDNRAWYASLEKVRKLSQENNAQVIFSHDNEYFKGIRKAPEWYE